MILLLSVIGPGSRYTLRRDNDRTLIARWFIEDPTLLETVGINIIALHLFIGLAWGLARIITRVRSRR